jgi:hypothetical protein
MLKEKRGAPMVVEDGTALRRARVAREGKASFGASERCSVALRACLVPKILQNFSKFSITSNL